MTMIPDSHHITAGCLNARRELLEQIDRLVKRLADPQVPALSPEDNERVGRIQAELSSLYSSTMDSYDRNRGALRELIAHKAGNVQEEAALEGISAQ